MSYDLFMQPRSGNITLKEFSAYFNNRPHYRVNQDEALYHNEDTDVYFSFDWDAVIEQASEGQTSGAHHPLAFNMNYCRPSYFINEAEPEVTQFISEFDLLIDDPQSGTEGLGAYDPREFAESWLEGNAGSYRVLAEQNPDMPTLPLAEQARVWEWNINRQVLQEQLAAGTYVPKISFATWRQRLVRFAVWTDGAPALIPAVDVLACVRNELAPRKLLRRRRPDIAVLEWEAALPLLEKHKVRMHEGAYDMAYINPPEEILAMFRKLTPVTRGFDGIPASQVLDRELLEAQKG